MGDRRYFRPRSPPIVHPARISLPIVNYDSSPTDLYPAPNRRDSNSTPRTSTNTSGPTVTTYKIRSDVPGRSSSLRDGRRRSTLDSTARPILVMPSSPRHPGAPGSGRPLSPVHNPYRSSDEGDHYTVPASSGRHRTQRPRYSATMDNADVNASTREVGGRDRSLRLGGGREGALYPRSRPIHSGSIVRHPDTIEDDYGDDGYGYTNPRDLVQYDLNQPTWYPPSRRDSQDSRFSRPSSISGYHDFMPRSFDARERGPPPTTRGFDRIPGRSAYDPSTVSVPIPESSSRSSRAELSYVPDPPRKQSSSAARPVAVFQEPERRLSRDEHYDPRDDERRERPRRQERYDDDSDLRGYPARIERNTRSDYRKDDYDKRNDHDGRPERKKGRDGPSSGLSVAGAALGLGTALKMKEEERDGDDERGDLRRRRESTDEPRRRREPREDRERVELTGRDPRERRHRDDRDIQEETRSAKERPPRDEKPEPLDLSGRNPQERHKSRDDRVKDEVPGTRDRRKHRESVSNGTDPDTLSESSAATDEMMEPRYRRTRPPREGPSVPFNLKNTMDLRALKDDLSKQDMPIAPVIPPKEPLSPEAAPGRDEPRELERTLRRDRTNHSRGRSSSASSRAQSEERHPMRRVVSPPREEQKKPEEIKPKGILRQPRAKFPEDPAPIREGVAPLKDSKKDGVPPDARWTKISRKLVNPDALIAGKERFEAREDFVIVLRVLSKEEVQAYATATQYIRAAREKEAEDRDRRHRRRERHERRRRRSHTDNKDDEGEPADHDTRRRSSRKEKEHGSHSESDSTDSEPLAIEDKPRVGTTENATDIEKPKAIEEPPKARRSTFNDGPGSSIPVMPSAPIPAKAVPVSIPASVPTAASTLPVARSMSINVPSTLQENPNAPGTYTGYVRNPPPPAATSAVGGRRD